MQLKEISLEDVFENDANPRQRFTGIDELADSMRDFDGGQPYNPITVMQEGEVYTLIDGARRYRAMLKLGTKRCKALVAESNDDAAVLCAMVATDNKQALDPMEMSRGVQQALAFADVERVERASGRRNLAKAKKAMGKVQDAAEDMSLDRLLKIEELSFSRRAVEELTNCRESDWKRVAEGIERRMEAERRTAELADAFDAAGIAISEERPGEGWAYLRMAGADDVPGLLEGRKPSDLMAISGCMATWSVYERCSDEDMRAAAEANMRIDRLNAAIEAYRKRRAAFLAQLLNGIDTKEGQLAVANSKAAAMCQRAFEERHGDRLEEFDEEHGTVSAKCMNEVTLVLGYTEMDRRWPTGATLADKAPGTWAKASWETQRGLMAAFAADGFEPAGEDERELLDALARDPWKEQ